MSRLNSRDPLSGFVAFTERALRRPEAPGALPGGGFAPAWRGAGGGVPRVALFFAKKRGAPRSKSGRRKATNSEMGEKCCSFLPESGSSVEGNHETYTLGLFVAVDFGFGR